MATVTQDDNVFLVNLLTAFITDVGNQFQMSSRGRTSLVNWLVSRLTNEGMAFVTKTLPKIGKHFDACLREGRYTPCSYLRKCKHGNLPVQFSGLFGAIFNSDGTMLGEPDMDAMRLIRQICFWFYKLETEFTDEQLALSYENFKKTEGEAIEEVPHAMHGVLYYAQELVKEIFQGFNPHDITPRPGPGQTACRTPREKRYEPAVLYPRANVQYPYSRYFYCGWRHLRDRRTDLYSLPVKLEPVSMLLGVPKDSRGPRIICEEPAEMMWLQQGLGRAMVSHIESHTLSRGHVNFTDQTINGQLALEASVDGRKATLDAKEASDRVWRCVVELLYHDVPHVRDALLSLSTRIIRMPDGSTIRTKKFAPMGSALCFPVMAMSFYALIYGSLQARDPQRSKRDILSSIYIYGDDIIINTDDVADVLQDLPQFGLKFNTEKSYFTGYFRESCGVDAYLGVNVTPVKFKSVRVDRSGSSLKKWCDHHYALFNRGLWNVARVVERRIEEIMKLPRVSSNSQCIGYKLWDGQSPPLGQKLKGRYSSRFDKNRKEYGYQCWMYRVPILVTKPICSMLGGWERFVRSCVHTLDSGPVYKRDQAFVAWSWIPDSQL